MNIMKLGMVSAIALGAAAPVYAQTAEAIAATDLNVRSGPGPQYDIVGVIPGGEAAMVDGCLDSASWCQVSFDGTQGWSYSDYLAVEVEEQAVALTERPASVEIGTVTYEDPEGTAKNETAGATAGATLGALTAAAVGGPIGGIVAGGILGGAAGSAAAEPDEKTVTYVRENPVETVYLDGEVVVGAGIPTTVETYEVPESEYRYVNINGATVLVDNETNLIVDVVR
ncbi:DUF1236 domain-containing protein [Sulfitobacter sp. S0837]|uniref:DUF1236 domain-containing protein n=1 Tax=Sulfitobacter maritimus TaxID=2741719 RepID=UPI001581956F|nr:DUF1236 domain-containing protein [Sulfitobacter maritimus]NUH66376.1 DUF1236 domain-containing protein [Sulfitobacter maritimus]